MFAYMFNFKFVLFACLVSFARAVTLTYKMAPHERACFYTVATKLNEKIAFYFAVRSCRSDSPVCWDFFHLHSTQVQAGGHFDIDWEVVSPNGNIVLQGDKERQGDYVFAAREIGEYSFCFSNSMSSFADKMIDFDVTAEADITSDYNKPTNQLPAPIPKTEEKRESVKQAASFVETSLSDIDLALNSLERSQRYYRTRENRNFDTVLSTESRIFWFSFSEILLIVSMAGLQVYAIQAMFSKHQSSSSFRV